MWTSLPCTYPSKGNTPKYYVSHCFLKMRSSVLNFAGIKPCVVIWNLLFWDNWHSYKSPWVAPRVPLLCDLLFHYVHLPHVLHLGHFQFFDVINTIVLNIFILVYVSWYIVSLGMKQLGYRRYECLTMGNNLALFYKAVVLIYTVTSNSTWDSLKPHLSLYSVLSVWSFASWMCIKCYLMSS